MDQNQILKNKEHFINLCKEHIQRQGLDKILNYLEKSDFYVAPSSGKYHLCEPGGLCIHSINVFETALRIYQQIVEPSIESGTGNFDRKITTESIAIAALFHDICKVNFYKECQRWRKDENNKWESYNGYEINDDFPIGHGEKSCILLHSFMLLTKEEMLAIRWHMGMFDMGDSFSSQSYSFRNALQFSPLISILHSADFLCANIIEKSDQK